MLVLICLATACGGAAQERGETGSAAPSRAAPAELASNQRVLTRAQSLELIDWAERFRACVDADGIEVLQIRAHARRIDLVTRPGHTAQELADGSVPCGDRLGGPPPGSSLQVAPSGFVLYLPRRCLLDEKVRKGHA